MNRQLGVDAFRVVAIIFVIVIHTVPFERPGFPVGSAWDAATVANQLARFAVPFFFTVSGYFWASRIPAREQAWQISVPVIRRLAFLFMVWCVIYLLRWNWYDMLTTPDPGPIEQFFKNLRSALRNPGRTLLQGTRSHLWFLPSLMACMALSSLFVRRQRDRLLFAVAVGLFLIGLAGKAYQAAPWGFVSGFNFRNGPFFALAFFVTGYALQRNPGMVPRLPVAIAVALAGAALQAGELLYLHQRWGTSMCQDYVVGTYFFGVGMTLVALSLKGSAWVEHVSRLAPWVLGVYVSHFMFVDLLRPLNQAFAGNPFWGVAIVAAVFVLSLALTWVLSRGVKSRRLVS